MLDLLLALFLSGCIHMKNGTMRPSSDVSTSWSQIPNDGLAHYLKVDDSFDQPDLTDYLVATPGAGFEELGLSQVPADLEESITFRLRGWARATDHGTVVGIVVVVNGSQFFDPVAGWDFSGLTLNQWQPLDVFLTEVPLLHSGDSVQVILQTFVGSGEVDVATIEVDLQYSAKSAAGPTISGRSEAGSVAPLVSSRPAVRIASTTPGIFMSPVRSAEATGRSGTPSARISSGPAPSIEEQ